MTEIPGQKEQEGQIKLRSKCRMVDLVGHNIVRKMSGDANDQSGS